jgi:hypothetical protein
VTEVGAWHVVDRKSISSLTSDDDKGNVDVLSYSSMDHSPGPAAIEMNRTYVLALRLLVWQMQSQMLR